MLISNEGHEPHLNASRLVTLRSYPTWNGEQVCTQTLFRSFSLQENIQMKMHDSNSIDKSNGPKYVQLSSAQLFSVGMVLFNVSGYCVQLF